MNKHLLEHLTRQFPDEVCGILWALRNNSFAWEYLTDHDNLNVFIQRNASVNEWKPGCIAKWAYSIAEKLDTEPSISAYDLFELQTLPKDLVEIGRVCVQLTGNLPDCGLSEVLRSVRKKFDYSDGSFLHAWQMLLVCYSCLVHDPFEMAVGLIHISEAESFLKLSSQILLSNYFLHDDLEERFIPLLSECSLAAKAYLLRYLYQIKPALVKSLSFSLLKSREWQKATTLEKVTHKELFGLPVLLFQNELVQYTEDNLTLKENAQSLQIMLSLWKKGIWLQITETGQPLTDDEDGEICSANHIALMDEIGNLLLSQDISPQRPFNCEGLFQYTNEMKQAYLTEDTAKCQEFAEKIIVILRDILQKSDGVPTALFVKGFDYSPLVRVLQDCGFTSHAREALQILLAVNPNDIRLLLVEAEINLSTGEVRKALESLQIAHLLDQEDGRVTRQLIEIYVAQGNFYAAYQLFKPLIVSGNKPSTSELEEIAELALATGDYDQALAYLRELTNAHSVTGNMFRMLGETLMMLDSEEEAIAILEKTVAVDAENPLNWIALADAYRKVDEEDLAIGVLENAAGQLPGSATIKAELARELFSRDMISMGLPILESATQLHPDTKNAVIQVGKLLTMLGDISGAFAYYQKALETEFFDVELAKIIAHAANEQEELPTARKMVEYILKTVEPNEDDYLLFFQAFLGFESLIFSEVKFVSQEQYECVVTYLVDAEKTFPENLHFQIWRAEVLALSGKWQESQAKFSHIIEKDNGTFTFRLNAGLGYTALKLRDYSAAVAAFEECIQQNPGYPSKMDQFLAEAYLATGIGSTAFQYAEKYAGKNPDDLNALLWYGQFCEDLGREQPGIRAFQQALEMRPDDVCLKLKLAELHFSVKEEHDAINLVNELRTIEFPEVNFAFRVVNLLIQLHQTTEAGEILTRLSVDERFVPGEVDFLLSIVHQQTGDLLKAFEFIQSAIDGMTDNHYLYFFQCDLLYLMEKPLAALSCLEYGQQMAEKNAGKLADLNKHARMTFSTLPVAWFENIDRGYGYLSRRIFLQWKLERFEQAATELIETKAEWQNDLLMRYIAATIFLANGDFSLAEEYFALSHYIEMESLHNAFSGSFVQLCSLLERESELLGSLENVDIESTDNFEVLAVCVKYQAISGNWKTAKALYQRAVSYQQERNNAFRQPNGYTFGFDIVHELQKTNSITLWEAEINLFNWQGVLTELQNADLQKPVNLAEQFALAKAVILCKEWDLCLGELEVITHRPPRDLVDETAKVFVQTTLEKMNGKMQSNDLERWFLRAQLAFNLDELNSDEISAQWKCIEDIEYLAGYFRRNGEMSRASTLAEKLGKYFPNTWQRALCFLGVDTERGIQLAQKSAASASEYPLVHAAFARLAAANGETLIAYRAISEALNIWHDEPVWHYSAAQLSKTLSNDDDVTYHLETAVKISANADWLLELAQNYILQSRAQDAVRVLEGSLVQEINNPDLLQCLGEAYYLSNEPEKAFECADKVKEMSPNLDTPHLLSAKISASINQLDAAMAYARRAFEINPDNETTLIFLSQLLEKSGDIENACELLESMILGGNASQKLMFEYVSKKSALYGPKSVLPILEGLYESNEVTNDLLRALAIAYMDAGIIQRAENIAVELIKREDSDPEMKLLLGKISRMKGQLDLAVHYIVDAIHENPDDIQAYLDLAEIHKERREIGEALAVYKHAISLFPDDARPYYESGLLLRESHDYPGAETMLKRAAALSPDDIIIRRRLGAVVALNLLTNVQEEKIVV